MNGRQAIGPSILAAIGAAFGSVWFAETLTVTWLGWAVLFGEVYVLLAILLFEAKTMELEASP